MSRCKTPHLWFVQKELLHVLVLTLHVYHLSSNRPSGFRLKRLSLSTPLRHLLGPLEYRKNLFLIPIYSPDLPADP